MTRKLLGVILTLLVVWNVQCQNISPPDVKTSYIAWGEISQPLPESNDSIVLQISFEESYDAQSKDSVFFLYLSGKNLTFTKNNKLNQTFLYVEKSKDSNSIECRETSENEFMTSDLPTSLLSYEDDDGTVKFSITQLINIPQKHLKKGMSGVPTSYRNISAKSWVYEIKGKNPDDDSDMTITITSYWSDGSWGTSGGQTVVPLGFQVSKRIESKPVIFENYFINVFGFMSNTYDHKFFEPFQGVICATRKKSSEFPRIKNSKAISFSFETTLPDFQEIRYTDTWFDPVNQLVRLDIQKKSTNRYSESHISIGKMGIVYSSWYNKESSECKITPFAQYSNDNMQALVDIKQNFSKWQMDKLFGLNDTFYTYLGKTMKHDIPCHIFQGIRTDWPDKNANVTSLWEWCFNYNMSKENDRILLQDDDIGLIHANVIILSHPNGVFNGYRLNHHFYKMKPEDPAMLDATSFDINRCFAEKRKSFLQFYLDVEINEDIRHVAENATSDLNFLKQWKAAIYKYSDLPEYSLRVTGVRATLDDNKLFIKFILLGIHDLPKEIKISQISSIDANTNLRRNVNAGKVSISYKWTNETSKLSAEKNSVSDQIDREFDPQTLAPLPPTTPVSTTPFIFSLRTEPDEKTTPSDAKTTPSRADMSTSSGDGTTTPSGGGTTTPSSGGTTTPSGGGTTTPSGGGTTTPEGDKSKKHVVKMTGHQPGSVAGVSIALLLIGVSIGSAGTFYKFNGLPECLKRRQ